MRDDSAAADEEEKKAYVSKAPRGAYQLSDFDIVGRLGDGSFSEVIQVILKGSDKTYALKIVDKRFAVRQKKVESLKIERKLLDKLDDPGIVGFYFSFQDHNSLYFGLELCPGGELFDQIQRKGKLNIEEARFYAAEVVKILAYLRSQKVVHGDLKPENLLLQADGHLKLIDFGSAHDLSDEACREDSRLDVLRGTADYTAPEALQANEAVGIEYDLWSLGCLIYQMLEGKPPFQAGSEYLTFQKILSLDYQIPSQWPMAAQDIVQALLRADPAGRLGAGSLSDMESHVFFTGIDWANIRTCEAPKVSGIRKDLKIDTDLDWSLTSLALSQPLKVEYDQ